MRKVSPNTVWGAVIGAGIAYEAYALKFDLDAALSRVTRAVFHVHRPAGKLAFTVTWLGFAGWFHRHILDAPVTPGSPAE